MFFKLDYMEILSNSPEKLLPLYYSIKKKYFLAARNQSFPQLRTTQWLFLSSVGVGRK